MDVLILLAVFLGLILFVFIQGYLNEKKELKKFREKLYSLKGKIPDKEYKIERFLRISAFFEKHPEEFQIDDITWNDLNMDEVFKRSNYCLSSTGEEVLYYLYRTPNFSEEELIHFDDITEYYGTNDEERVQYQLLMKELGTTGKYSLYDYMGYLTGLEIHSNKKELIRILFLPLAIVSFWINLTAGILLILAWIIWQIFDYYKKKGEIEPYTVSLAYVMRLLNVANKVKDILPDACEHEKEKIIESPASGIGRGVFVLQSSPTPEYPQVWRPGLAPRIDAHGIKISPRREVLVDFLGLGTLHLHVGASAIRFEDGNREAEWGRSRDSTRHLELHVGGRRDTEPSGKGQEADFTLGGYVQQRQGGDDCLCR